MNKVSHMNTGNGETSYSNNSGLQKLAVSKTLPVLGDTLRDMFHNQDHNFFKCLKIVDLGCSSGLNTLFTISHILDTVEEWRKSKGFHAGLPEIEVFLNDLPHNDFNNLFKLLPNFHQENQKRKAKCFLYGLPGSFYDRLFPSKSLHFAFSCYSLHWLSQVPDGLATQNKENIYISMASTLEVFEAYAKQFHKDFSMFLRLRGEEMISGGRMVLTFIGRSVEDPSSKDDCGYLTLFARTLVDIMSEGLVKVDDLHSFNMPVYMPCEQEVEKIIEDEGSFTSDKIQVFRVGWDATFDEEHHEEEDEEDWENNLPCFDKYSSGKIVSDGIRALMEPMLVTHFGLQGPIVDRLFQRYAESVGEHMSVHKSSYFNITVSLRRK